MAAAGRDSTDSDGFNGRACPQNSAGIRRLNKTYWKN
jgi:hypothetical protein